MYFKLSKSKYKQNDLSVADVCFVEFVEKASSIQRSHDIKMTIFV